MTDAPADSPAVRFRSDMTVQLVKHSAADTDVLWAARVSTAGEQSLDEIHKDPERSKGLINFLMRDRHGSPFEHNSMTFLISAPLFVFREFHRHRVGWCVTGDTEITTESVGERSGRTLRRVPIRDLYTRWHHGVVDSRGRVRHLPSVRAQQVRVLNEESLLFERAPIVDVVSSGVKEVITLRTETGQTLRCTREHALFTNEGWVKAGDLDPSHLLTVAGRRSHSRAPELPAALRRGIAVWLDQQRDSRIRRVDTCHACGAVLEREHLVLDHLVFPSQEPAKALDVRNLAPACRPCHRRRRREERELTRRRVTAGARFVRYERVGDVREEETYDLSVAGPWHNFLANGIVVHNSYNEESGRYRELEPVFYLPDEDRRLVQQGRPGKYQFVPGTPEQYELTRSELAESYRQSYAAYQRMLRAGIAREVARSALPLGLYSSMYATCNARSLMHFLSLRTQHELAKVPSFPQREIAMVGERMEAEWARLMPLTHAAFNANGRVAP